MSERNSFMSRIVLAGLAGTTLLGAAGCTPAGLAVGAGATAGVAASEERGIKGSFSDTKIRLAINDAWLHSDFDIVRNVSLQIYEGRVLLAGLVATQEQADTAVRLAWQADGVREVINEIQVGPGGGIAAFADDTVINARLDTALLFEKGVSSVNYSTRSVGGTVYLLGVAQNQDELDRVFRVVRSIPKVRSVVSHVIMKDDPRRFREPSGGDTTTPAATQTPSPPSPGASSPPYGETAPSPAPSNRDTIETRPLPEPGAGSTR